MPQEPEPREAPGPGEAREKVVIDAVADRRARPNTRKVAPPVWITSPAWVSVLVQVLFLAAVALLLWPRWEGWSGWSPVARARLAAVFLVLVLLVPVGQFLLFGWRQRRVEVLALFPPKAVLLYYRTYFPGTSTKYVQAMDARLAAASGEAANDVQAEITAVFQKHFDQRYGRRHFLMPIGLLVLVSATLTILCAGFLIEHPPTDEGLKADPSNFTVIMCLLAAYVWVLYDFFSRERSLDFSTTHIHWASFRLVISVPLAYAIPALWGAAPRLAVAFLLGAFPTGLLMTLLRRRAFQSPVAAGLGVSDAAADRLTSLETLPSVDTSVADRFREEGITTISQLASADPVALTIRSGFDLDLVFSCISEALAWYYLQKEGVDVARTFSIPGALEVYGLIDELDYDPKGDADDPARQKRYTEDQKLADEVVRLMAEKLKWERPVLERILRSIWDDSRVEFLAHLMDALRDTATDTPPPPPPGRSVARKALGAVSS